MFELTRDIVLNACRKGYRKQAKIFIQSSGHSNLSQLSENDLLLVRLFCLKLLKHVN